MADEDTTALDVAPLDELATSEELDVFVWSAQTWPVMESGFALSRLEQEKRRREKNKTVESARVLERRIARAARVDRGSGERESFRVES